MQVSTKPFAAQVGMMIDTIPLTQSDVAEVVIAAAREGTDADSAVLYEVVEEREMLRRLAATGLTEASDCQN